MPDPQEKKLLFYRWFLTNRALLRRVLIIFLLLLCATFWIWALVNLGTLLLSARRDAQSFTDLIQTQVNFSTWRQKHNPAALEISPAGFTAASQASGSSYDFVALVANPNQNWYAAKLEYQFVWDGGVSRTAITYLLPLESKRLLLLGEPASSFTGNAQLKIISTDWQRISPDLNLPVVSDQDFTITAPDFVATADGSLVNMRLAITNESPFSFWEAPVNIILYRGGTLIGARVFILDKFLADQTRQVEINWPGDLLVPDQTNIELDVDFFNRDVYIPF